MFKWYTSSVGVTADLKCPYFLSEACLQWMANGFKWYAYTFLCTFFDSNLFFLISATDCAVYCAAVKHNSIFSFFHEACHVLDAIYWLVYACHLKTLATERF